MLTVVEGLLTSIQAMDVKETTPTTSDPKVLSKALSEGINFFIHYKPQPWSKRLLILNQIKEQLRSKNVPEDIMQTYLATPTELHFTLGWGRILPVRCISNVQCTFVPIPKDPLKDIYQALNDIRNKDGFDVNHAYREFRSLFHQGSRLYLFESYPIKDWDEFDLIILVNAIKLIFKKYMGVSFGELKDPDNPENLTKFEIIHELHKVMGQFNQRVVENTTYYDLSLIQDQLLTEAKEQGINKTSIEEDVIKFCDDFIETRIDLQLKNSRNIGEAVLGVKNTLRNTLNSLFNQTTFKAYHYDSEDKVTVFEMRPLDLFIHWDLIGVRNQEKIKKAKNQCKIYLDSTRANNLVEFYDHFKRSFIGNFKDTPIKIMGKPQDFSYGNKIITVLQVNEETEKKLRARYREFLRNYLDEKYLPTPEIPSGIDPTTTELGLNYIGKELNWDKKICPNKSDPQQCFMIVAEKEYYNGQSHFKYHMTLLNKTLSSEVFDNIPLQGLEKQLLTLKDIDKIKGVDDLGLNEANIRFFDHKVIQTKIMGPDLPRYNEEIIATTVLVKSEDGSSLTEMHRDVAIAKANLKGKDLVEVSATTFPPICEIIDFGEYVEKKREEANQRKTQTRDFLTFDIEVGDGDLLKDLSTQMTKGENAKKLLDLQQTLKESKMGMEVHLEFPTTMREEDAEKAADNANNHKLVAEFFSHLDYVKVMGVRPYYYEGEREDEKISLYGISVYLKPIIHSEALSDYVQKDISKEFEGTDSKDLKNKSVFLNPLADEIKKHLEGTEDPLIITVTITWPNVTVKAAKGRVTKAINAHLKSLLTKFNAKPESSISEDGTTLTIKITRDPRKD
jgi:translation initiation factor IF-3